MATEHSTQEEHESQLLRDALRKSETEPLPVSPEAKARVLQFVRENPHFEPQPEPQSSLWTITREWLVQVATLHIPMPVPALAAAVAGVLILPTALRFASGTDGEEQKTQLAMLSTQLAALSAQVAKQTPQIHVIGSPGAASASPIVYSTEPPLQPAQPTLASTTQPRETAGIIPVSIGIHPSPARVGQPREARQASAPFRLDESTKARFERDAERFLHMLHLGDPILFKPLLHPSVIRINSKREVAIAKEATIRALEKRSGRTEYQGSEYQIRKTNALPMNPYTVPIIIEWDFKKIKGEGDRSLFTLIEFAWHDNRWLVKTIVTTKPEEKYEGSSEQSEGTQKAEQSEPAATESEPTSQTEIHPKEAAE